MKEKIEIETVLRELYSVSGCRVSIHDSEYNEIAAYPRDLSPFCTLIQQNPANHAACLRCDSGAQERARRAEAPYIFRCHMGLYEAVAPLYHSGVLTGYLMIGQVADASTNSLDNIFTRALESCGGFYNEEELSREVARIATTDNSRFSSFVNIMTICAEYITLTGKLNLPARDLAHMVKKYLHQNYGHHISLDDLCENFRCSKSTLMNTFRNAYGITVGKYLTQIRLDHARRLLIESDRAVRDIAAECGFTDQGYFTKVFAAAEKCAPTDFRKIRRREQADEPAMESTTEETPA